MVLKEIDCYQVTFGELNPLVRLISTTLPQLITPQNRSLSHVAFHVLRCCILVSGICVFNPDLCSGEINAETSQPQQTGEVLANILNVRAKPDVKYEVLCQLKKGETVTIHERKDEWLGIQVPTRAEAWIAANQLDDKNIVATNTPVYAGPGMIFSTYTKIKEGEKVSVLKRIDDKWARIVPPSHAVVWIHGNYVRSNFHSEPEIAKIQITPPKKESRVAETIETEIKNADALSNAPTPETRGGEREEVKKVIAIKTKPLLQDIIYIGESREVEKLGTVITLDRHHLPFQYALAIAVDTSYYPLAYLTSDNHDIENCLWEEVSINGREQWMKGWPRPVIQVQFITERK